MSNIFHFDLDKKCNNIIKLIEENDCLIYGKQTDNTLLYFKEFFTYFQEAEQFLKIKDIFTNKPIIISNKFYKPNDNEYNYIIEPIRKYIEENAKKSMKYSYNFFDKEINIYFTIDNKTSIKEIHKCLYQIIFWLYVVTKYSNTNCSKILNIFIYLTTLEKNLPKIGEEIDEININTGFTSSCTPKSNIVIYRREEWYKVFIHETLHNLGIDFSGMDNRELNKQFYTIFKINFDPKLYEAYTDSWAKILNVLVCSYLISDKTYKNYIINTERLMNIERTHCFLQCIKILNYMNIEYEDLFEENEYKENTSMLSYYILNSVILNNYQYFLLWCKNNNKNLLQFDKNKKSSIFFEVIKKNYKTKSYITRLKCKTVLFHNIKKEFGTSLQKSLIKI